MNAKISYLLFFDNKQAVREAATICRRPLQVDLDLLTLKVVSESRVTWANSVPMLVILGLSVLDLGQMYAADRRQTQTDVRRTSSLNASPSEMTYTVSSGTLNCSIPYHTAL